MQRLWLTAGAAIVLGNCGGDDPAETRLPFGVYSEFLSYQEVEESLGDLSHARADLNIGVPNEDIGDAALAHLLSAAQDHDVPVRLWLLLAREDGYWPNEDNIGLFADEVTRLLNWVEEESLEVDAVVYDLEPSISYSEEIAAAFADSITAVANLLRTHQDPAAYEDARGELMASVAEVKARGLKAVAITYPQVVDDVLDGDDDIQDALDIPNVGVPFDEVGFMVYQTVFADQIGGWIGPGLVASYGADAVQHFGERAVMALGVIGSVGIFEHQFGYDEQTDLEADIAAARDAGIERFELYSLDGMRELGGVGAWLETPQALPAAADVTVQTDLVRAFFSGFDSEEP